MANRRKYKAKQLILGREPSEYTIATVETRTNQPAARLTIPKEAAKSIWARTQLLLWVILDSRARVASQLRYFFLQSSSWVDPRLLLLKLISPFHESQHTAEGTKKVWTNRLRERIVCTAIGPVGPNVESILWVHCILIRCHLRPEL